MRNLNIYILLFLVFLLGGIFSCKKDLGDYEYVEIQYPEIDTTGVAASYYIEQYGRLVINPEIDYPGDTSNLSYQWLIYKKATSSNSVTPSKEISSSKNLDVTISEETGNYIAEMIVTEKSTGIKANITFSVYVAASIETGWLVLHTQDNKSDVDYIVTTTAVPSAPADKWLKNIYSEATGAPLTGEPRFISATKRNYYAAQNWIMVGSSEELTRMDPNSFYPMIKNDELFRRDIETFNPQADMNCGSYELLINDNKLHVLTLSGFIEDALFGAAFYGDYELAPFMVYSPYYRFGAVVYDQKNEQFLYTTSTVSNYTFVQFKAPVGDDQIALFDLSNIGKEMLFMDYGFNRYTYALFKDKTGNQRWLYVINFSTKADDGKLGIAKYEATNLPEIEIAKFYQCGEIGNVFYYATDRTIYYYDYYGTNTASIAYNSFSANETITSMKIYKPRPNTNLTTVEDRILYVATWDGTQGRVYEFAINPTSGEIISEPLHIFEGFGKVADMCPKSKGA